MDTYLRGSDSRWTTQFGLYRYQSADPNKPNIRKLNSVIYLLIAMACIAIFLVFFFIIYENNNKQQQKSISVPNIGVYEEEIDNLEFNDGDDDVNGHEKNDDHDLIVQQNSKSSISDEFMFNKNQTRPLYYNHKLLNDTELIFSDRSDSSQSDGSGEVDSDELKDITDYSEEEIDGSGAGDETIESVDSIHPEKLIYPPNFYRKPPRSRRRKYYNRRQFATGMGVYEPRPFDFALNGPEPIPFQKSNVSNGMTTYEIPSNISKDNKRKVNNIQDILNQGEMYPSPYQYTNKPPVMRRKSHIKFAGVYRHPKDYGDMVRLFTSKKPKSNLVSSSSSVKPTALPQTTTTTKFINDPFHNYKPQSMSDINLMATNQFRFAPLPAASHKDELAASTKNPFIPVFSPFPTKYYYPLESQKPYFENIYQQIVNTSQGIRAPIGNKRIGNAKTKSKPFSLMLDIYPMDDDNPGATTKKPNYRRPPFFPQPQGFVPQANIPPIDHSYFNSMKFPQIQAQRYPMHNHYFNPYYNRGPLPTTDRTTKFYPSGGGVGDSKDGTVENPGQMVVHLNLFPKNKKAGNRNVEIIQDRSSEERDNVDPEFDAQSREIFVSDMEMDRMRDNYTNGSNYDTTELNTGEFLTIPPNLVRSPFSTNQARNLNFNKTSSAGSSNVEIIRSIEIHPNINFDDVDLNMTSSSSSFIPTITTYTTTIPATTIETTTHFPFTTERYNFNFNDPQTTIDSVNDQENLGKHRINSTSRPRSTLSSILLDSQKKDINYQLEPIIKFSDAIQNYNRRQDNIDDIDLIPSNHKISDKIDFNDNDDTRDVNNSEEITDEEVEDDKIIKNRSIKVDFVKFETKDAIKKNSARDFTSQLNTNEKFIEN